MLILTAPVKGTVIGTGAGLRIDSAQNIAATRALQYLRAHGIPDNPGAQWPLHMLSIFSDSVQILFANHPNI